MLTETELRNVSQLYENYRVYGPYVRSVDQRVYYVLAKLEGSMVRKGGKKKSILLSRLRVESSLGRVLTTEEEVDHKDGDKTNDQLENLQVLGRIEHKVKDGLRLGKIRRTRRKVKCPCCNAKFSCPAFRIKEAKVKGKQPCCSRSCASRMYGSNQYT